MARDGAFVQILVLFEEKNALSHRAAAVANLVARLRKA